jgi:demethylspheroidene O-methyltransferase
VDGDAGEISARADVVHDPNAGRTQSTGWLRTRWCTFRDRMLQDVRFQRWASGFPLTAWIARKRTSELFDLTAGFVYSQIMQALIELEILPQLSGGPAPFHRLMSGTGLSEDAARRLFDGGVALRLMERRGTLDGQTLYGLGDLGGALLANPGVMAMIRHHALLYRDMADPVGLLRGKTAEDGHTELSRYWAYARNPDASALKPDMVSDYSALMGISQAFIASEILDAYPIGLHKTVLDIGGGEGAFIKAAAVESPETRFALFDLPAVAARAETGFAELGLAERCTAHGGNMFESALPPDADLICLIRVLYDHPDADILRLLGHIRAQMQPGQTLLVAEPMAGVSGAERMGDAYFGMYLFAMHGGRPRTEAELSGFLKKAGFSRVSRRKVRNPMLTGVLTAQP